MVDQQSTYGLEDEIRLPASRSASHSPPAIAYLPWPRQLRLSQAQPRRAKTARPVVFLCPTEEGVNQKQC